MSRCFFWLPFPLVVSLFSSAALASEIFPGTIQAALMLGTKPLCTLCHTSDPGVPGTATQPFARTARNKYGLMPGDTKTLIDILGKMRDARDDSDGDGDSDIDELKVGHDPNINDITHAPPGDYPPPVYGCHAARGQPCHARTGQWSVAAVGLLVAVWLRARRSPKKLVRVSRRDI